MKKILTVFLLYILSNNILANTFDIPRHPSFRQIYVARDNALVLVVDNGIVRSIDNGKTWKKVFEDDAHRGALLLIKQEKYLLLVVRGGKIYQSKDEGKTWKIRGLSADVDWSYNIGNNQGKYPSKIDEKGIIYVSDKNKLHISSDGGLTWSSTYPFSDSESDRRILDLAIFKSRIYLTTQDSFLRSEDKGKTWKVISSGKFPEIFGETAIDGSQLSGLEVSSRGEIFLSAPDGIFVSEDGGANWALRKFESSVSPFRVIYSRSDAIYFFASRQQPTSREYFIFRSKDGKTLSDFSFHYPWQDMKVGQDGTIYIATEKAIYKTKDEGLNWDIMTNENIKWYH